MKFIAHDHYNNNGYLIGHFEHAYTGYGLNEWPIIVTDAGITFFSLCKPWKQKEKFVFAKHLHAALIEKFGHGLSAVTCSVSDCVRAEEFDATFQGGQSHRPGDQDNRDYQSASAKLGSCRYFVKRHALEK